MEPDIAIINIKNLKERMNREYRKEFYGYIGDIDIINKTIDTLLEERQQDKEKIKKLEEENTSKQKAYDDCYCEFKHYKQYESIPVSLVEETIEELKEKRDDYLYKLQVYGDFRINEPNYSDLILQINFKIQVLQELLEKR